MEHWKVAWSNSALSLAVFFRSFPCIFRHIGYNVDPHFWHQSYNVDPYGQSFFPKCISAWNGLAQEIAEANTLDLFKGECSVF